MDKKYKKQVKNNYRKIKTNDPDYLFDKTQFYEINKDFYENFLDGFFFIKISNLIKLLNSSIEEQKELFNFQMDIFRVSSDYKYTEKSIYNYVSTEIVMTTFHCMETFVRLYIAHSALSECPNMVLAKLSINEYRKNLQALVDNKFNYMNQNQTNTEIIANVFFLSMENLEYYCKEKEYSIEEVTFEYMNYLNYAANFLLDNSEYNTYKHGFYMQQVDHDYQIKNKGGGISGKGSAFDFIRSINTKDGKKWAKISKFFDIEHLSKVTIMFEHYFTIMLRNWEIHLLRKEDSLLLTKPMELLLFFENKKSNSVMSFLDSMNIEGSNFTTEMDLNTITFEYRYFINEEMMNKWKEENRQN